MPSTITRNTDTLKTGPRKIGPRTEWAPHTEYDPDAHWDAAGQRPDDN